MSAVTVEYVLELSMIFTLSYFNCLTKVISKTEKFTIELQSFCWNRVCRKPIQIFDILF